MHDIIRKIQKDDIVKERPEFNPGDTIAVSQKIKEGNKERVQAFQGVVIQKNGGGSTKTFTVRKSSGNVYVEKIFPLNSPLITEIKVMRKGKVRRAKLYYLRQRTGKATRIKQKK
ncbi:MAG: 50S ribosomal protein L19 [Chitinivibrionales bacterium]|nr:50S ribosomal protein L19 [Chitinivibrionales bacterium]